MGNVQVATISRLVTKVTKGASKQQCQSSEEGWQQRGGDVIFLQAEGSQSPNILLSKKQSYFKSMYGTQVFIVALFTIEM